VNRSIRVQKK